MIVERVQEAILGLWLPQELHLVRPRLEAKGFFRCGDTSMRELFKIKEDTESIVKVFKSLNHKNRHPNNLLPEAFRFLYLPAHYNSNGITIQPWANDFGGTKMQALEKILKIFATNSNLKPLDFDVCERNCAFHNGSPYILDYS